MRAPSPCKSTGSVRWVAIICADGDVVITVLLMLRLLYVSSCTVLDAPSEAEAQCAIMCKAGLVYGVATEDMDCLTFGCPRVGAGLATEIVHALDVRACAVTALAALAAHGHVQQTFAKRVRIFPASQLIRHMMATGQNVQIIEFDRTAGRCMCPCACALHATHARAPSVHTR